MGSNRAAEQQSNQTQTVTPQILPEQRRQIELQTERLEAAQPGLLQQDQALLGQINRLAQGQPLQGQLFSQLGQGIAPEVQQELVTRQLNQITPRLEQLGILRSGVTGELAQRAATDISVQSELERIRQQENLLNVLQGFPATVNAPIASTQSNLASQLAGLTPVTTTGNFFGTSTPFLPSFGRTFSQSFAQSLGQSRFGLFPSGGGETAAKIAAGGA